MIQRENVSKGLLVRLLSDYLDCPAGTRATVEEVGVLSGEWWFTVQFDAYKPITPAWRGKPRPTNYNTRSLRLRLDDLALFEVASEAETTEASLRERSVVGLKLPSGWRRRGLGRDSSVPLNQLSLFLADDF